MAVGIQPRGASDAPAATGPAIDKFANTIVLTVGALLPILNPVGLVPMFLSLTGGFSEPQRNRQALLACIYAFSILVAFLLLGEGIIRFFGLSIPGIRIAGGLIIAMVGFRMLLTEDATPAASVSGKGQGRDIAFTPLAMPGLSGPGSISVVLTATAHLQSKHPDDLQIIYLAVVVGMAVTLAVSYAVLRLASSASRVFGTHGIDAMTRIFGFLTIAMGMQFLLIGISDFFRIPHA